MDISGLIGPLSGPSSYSDSNTARQATVTAGTANPASNAGAAEVLAPAVASAPSPTPAAVIASGKALSPNIRYAPSPPPDGAHFDRSA